MSPSVKTARDLRQSETRAEQLAWELLRNGRFLGLKFRRQHPIGNCIVDFYCFYCFRLRLAIELNGSVHSQPSQIRRDQVRDAYLKRQGIQVLRLPNGLVLQDPEGFLNRIRECIPSPGAARHLLPKGEGRKSAFTLPSPWGERGRG